AIGESVPADVGHDHVDHALRFAEREQRNHRWVTQVRQGAGLTEQPLALGATVTAVAAENLDRHEPVEVALAREIDGPECAGAKRPNDLIPVVEQSLD